MECKKVKGIDIFNEGSEASRFIKKWIKAQKYASYTANQHMREEQLLRRRALNCWDREPPEEVLRKRREIIKELKGEKY
ncbi:MAG: hypothetical protein IJ287_03330 [Methanobrevibacter sp.]|nr:hypothetical protein [Methanobrevibacter sp.]MBR1748840.1 hypothetical protein [Bacilli bacterium]